MEQLRERVAVVTGAASGIGRALAQVFAEEGARVVLADVEEAPLREAAAELEAAGAEALAVPTDVARPEAVRALAERSLERFGAVHVLCNNAGVFAGGLCWDSPLEDFHWVMNVNTWGVLHGIQAFVPIMLRQDTECHVVNTSSMAGVTTMPFVSAYHMSKHAVVALSECLYKELRGQDAKVGVSVLCPELVDTRIGTSERNRPEALRARRDPAPARDLVEKALRESTRTGLPPRALAQRVVDAIRRDRFYVLSEADVWRAASDARCQDLIAGRNPRLETIVPEG